MDEPDSHHGGSYRPYRGRARGRGRGFFRGGPRGGPPRASMKLDNRPKSLLVKGAISDNEQALRDWYEVRIPSFFVCSFQCLILFVI